MMANKLKPPLDDDWSAVTSLALAVVSPEVLPVLLVKPPPDVPNGLVLVLVPV